MITTYFIIISILTLSVIVYIFFEKYDKDGLDIILVGLMVLSFCISILFVVIDPDNGELFWPYHRHEGFMTTAFALSLLYFNRKKEQNNLDKGNK